MGDKPTLKVGHISITDHLILGITKDKIEKTEETFNHFSLQTVPMMSWQEVANGISDNSLDAACILAPTAMDLFKSGANIKLTLFSHKTGSVFIKNKAANIKTIEDIRGKVVIIPYQLSVHNMLLHKLLSENGLNPGTGKDKGVDVLLEVMAPSQMPMALQYDDEGEIAGFIVAEPYGAQVIKEGFGELFYLSKDLWADHPCCVVVVNNDIIGKYPDAVQELTNSLVSSGKFIQDNPEKAAEIGAPFLGQNVDVVKTVLTHVDRVKTGDLFPKIEDLDTMQDYMCNKMKVMSDKIDLEKFVDTQFAKNAGAT